MSIEANEFELKKKTFDIDIFLQEVLDLIYLYANRKQIAINLEKSGNVPTSICSDKQRLQQIILHLLMNAVKYSPQSKTITIRITPDDLEPNLLVFQVADQGIGIAREKQINLFKLFGGSGYLDDLQGKAKQGKWPLRLRSRLWTDDHQPAVREARQGVERGVDCQCRDDLHICSEIRWGAILWTPSAPLPTGEGPQLWSTP
jgi:hypothetical protein